MLRRRVDYFADATLASAFVARWCAATKVETAGGVFQVREGEPARCVSEDNPAKHPPAVYRDLVLEFYQAKYFHQKGHRSSAAAMVQAGE